MKCPRCGNYDLQDAAAGEFEAHLHRVEHRKGAAQGVASRIIRLMPRDQGGVAKITLAVVKDILRRRPPTPQEQCDNLISWLGEQIASPEQNIRVHTRELGVMAGTSTQNDSYDGVHFLLTGLADRKLVRAAPVQSGEPLRWDVSLTFDGWSRYHVLEKLSYRTRNAFMAMQFNDPLVDTIYRDHFIGAVAETGFSLLRLDDAPRAGLIDNRLRAEIRAAAFLIADLTRKNPGAYWEAGFAEGLGKPVIYTCEEGAFRRKRTRPHFDVNHHTTIIWSKAAPNSAADQLKATIRNTLPADAKPGT